MRYSVIYLVCLIIAWLALVRAIIARVNNCLEVSVCIGYTWLCICTVQSKLMTEMCINRSAKYPRSRLIAAGNQALLQDHHLPTLPYLQDPPSTDSK